MVIMIITIMGSSGGMVMGRWNGEMIGYWSITIGTYKNNLREKGTDWPANIYNHHKKNDKNDKNNQDHK